jgi:hypothetical protein
MKLVVIFAGLVALTAATPLVFGRDSIDCNIPNGYSLGRLETGVLNQANGHNCMKEAKSNRPEVGQCFFTRIKTAWMEQVESYLLTVEYL